ncbi:MAG TPA: class D sortase [Candidatus Sulfotelmatobacter sp.]|nr:class D sortase [Candidatus Sulfotelmatobacter sp.]
MKAAAKAFRILERGLLLLGLLLLVVFALAHIHRFIMFRTEMEKFETRQLESTKQGAAGIEATHNTDLQPAQNPDYSLWSDRRMKLHQASLRKPVESLAVLRIPALRLEVPVLEGTDEITLNRGVGRIAGTSHPGQGGNIGIAGHRDGFFRRLKDIRTGDAIELVTISGTDVFVVDQIRITNPADVSVLRPREKDSLTLVTCYPFYFVGPAPNRYIVEASLNGQSEQDKELQGKSLLPDGGNQ